MEVMKAEKTEIFIRPVFVPIEIKEVRGMLYVTVPTPPGWKCERPDCTITFKHRHTAEADLYAKT